jgi:hypothetical protein
VATRAARRIAALRPAVIKDPEPPRDIGSELGHKCDYRFEAIDWFDARRGYKRFPGGVGNGIGPHPPVGYGDLWRNRSGDVVGRMTSQGYRAAFKVVTEYGAPVLDEEIDVVHDDLMDLLGLWIDENVNECA